MACADIGGRNAWFEEVYRATWGAATRYARHRTATIEDANDAVSSTFEIVWRRLDDMPPGRETPWVIGILRRVLANYYRSAARESIAQERARAGALVHATGTRPEDLSLQHADLVMALQSLEPSQGEILMRALVYDRDELAAALGCSSNAVSIRLYRARRALALALDDAHEVHTPLSAVKGRGVGHAPTGAVPT